MIAQSIAKRAEASTSLGDQALAIYKKVCEQGKADMDFSVVYKFIQGLSDK